MADPLSELLSSILGPPFRGGAPAGGVTEETRPPLTGDRSLPRPLRTNNPGAIEFGDFAKRHGATGSDGRFAIFPDLESGYRAQEALLGSYMQEGRRSVSDIIRKWAPITAGSSENVQGQRPYIESVARTLGVGPNDPLTPGQIPQLAEAMAAFESGRPVPRSGGTTPSTPNAAATRQPTTRGPTTMADNTQARPAPFESIFDFLGPPAALRNEREQQRGATERLGMVQGATEAERVRSQRIIDEAMGVWRDIMSPQTGAGAPTNINEALMRFAQTPQFFALGQAGANYTDVIRKLQTNPNAPITLSPGQQGFRDSPEGVVTPIPGMRVPPNQTARPETSVDKARTEMLQAIAKEAGAATEQRDNLAQLGASLEATGGGLVPGLRGLAAAWGVTLGSNATDLQVAQAMVDRLTPSQRQGLPGSASDRDVRMFRSSLPSLFRQPDANRQILAGLTAIAEHRVREGEIANRVFTGEITPQQALAELAALPAPTQLMRERQATEQAAAFQKATGIDLATIREMTDQQLIEFQREMVKRYGNRVPPLLRQAIEAQAAAITRAHGGGQ